GDGAVAEPRGRLGGGDGDAVRGTVGGDVGRARRLVTVIEAPARAQDVDDGGPGRAALELGRRLARARGPRSGAAADQAPAPRQILRGREAKRVEVEPLV